MIENRIKEIEDKINNICNKKRFQKDSITLVAVTKTVPIDEIKQAVFLGIKNIGENRIQEAQSKFSQLSNEISSIQKHFIGHLQTNKAKKAVELFDLIQSVDSLRLAQEIDKHAKNINKIQNCLLEIKISEEDTKFGINPKQIEDFIIKTDELGNIRICGLMTMSPYFENKEKTRPYFCKMKEIFEKIRPRMGQEFSMLSMGISNDFEIAIEEGSNMVRIGTYIFGERQNNQTK